jgi:hypothetical protein
MHGDGMDETQHDLSGTRYDPRDAGGTRFDPNSTQQDMGQTQHDLSGTRYDPRDAAGTQYDPRSPAGTQYDPRDAAGTQYDPRDAAGTQYDPQGTRRLDATRQIPADDVLMRFGPGVSPDVIDTWRSGRGRPIKQRSAAKRVTGLLVTLAIAVLAGVVVWWLLHGAGTALTATGATVHTPAAVQPCGSSVNVTGVITTNGGGGDISYRWRRSDGQDSGILTDSVTHGRHSITVRLRWTVTGPGTLHAVATLDVLSPVKQPVTAKGAFDYSCSH